MNSHQRRLIKRKTGKIVHMNTVTCPMCFKSARPTAVGFFCPKCQMWGNMSVEETNLSKTMSDKEWEKYVDDKWKNRWK